MKSHSHQELQLEGNKYNLVLPFSYSTGDRGPDLLMSVFAHTSPVHLSSAEDEKPGVFKVELLKVLQSIGTSNGL